ncbi:MULTISPECIES: mannosyltransferase family protein [unclassified Microcoleus]|uniref:mannosyltransferase family protein n=1 Tax=unclassified Microcoleus TaxID=2642155 RepID=UPI0025ECEF4B|nr:MULTISPECIES: mannosyltransferase family protein [unclassified Microcoleus]
MTNADLGLEVSPRQAGTKSRDGLIFVIAMWLLSRSVIAIGMQLIAPFLYHHSLLYQSQDSTPVVARFIPKSGWELFSHWDGGWYTKIATLGYSYADDGEQHSVAFYPLFPLLIRGLMALGMRSDVAGVLINSFAFLGALVLIYFWVEQRYDTGVAKWTTAMLAWCPFSLFCTVMYTEGLFLFLTASALRSFERGEYIWAAVWGALTTATRGPGVALIPTFLLTAWREKRPPLAYAAGFASALGLLSFSLYCALRFGDALAFVHVQKGWAQPSWFEVLIQALKLKLSAISRIVMIFGSGYLLWFLRKRLSTIVLTYGFCSLALLLNSGALRSVNRYAYGMLPLSIALGLLLAAKPRWGYGLMGLFGIFLLYVSVRFAGWLWVA